MTGEWFKVFFELLITYSDWLAFFFMVVSMMVNAGIVSVIYPFAVFGYAMMEETTPKKRFWVFMLVYTEFIILLKFLTQMNFWFLIFKTDESQRNF